MKSSSQVIWACNQWYISIHIVHINCSNPNNKIEFTFILFDQVRRINCIPTKIQSESAHLNTTISKKVKPTNTLHKVFRVSKIIVLCLLLIVCYIRFSSFSSLFLDPSWCAPPHIRLLALSEGLSECVFLWSIAFARSSRAPEPI